MRYTISLLCASLAAAAPVLTPARAWAEVPRVMTDIPPIQSLTAQVMGELGVPGVLLTAGANAHDFQLRPSQVAALAQADLVIWVGPEMTPWLDRTLDGVADEGARLGLLDVAGTATRAFGGEGEGHDPHAAPVDGHIGGTETEDHAAAHAGTDPHAWLHPGNAQVWLAAIAAELSRLDPPNAAIYAANAQSAAQRIADHDALLAARLQPVAGKPFVVFHDAYGYFTDHYGLTVSGAIGLGDAASPGAAHLKDVQAGLVAGQARCIFPETNHDPKLVGILAEGTGVRVGRALDPEGSLLEPGTGLYAAMLSGLAETLVGCLGDG